MHLLNTLSCLLNTFIHLQYPHAFTLMLLLTKILCFVINILTQTAPHNRVCFCLALCPIAALQFVHSSYRISYANDRKLRMDIYIHAK